MEWFDREGGSFDRMLILDAESRMSGARIARMIGYDDILTDEEIAAVLGYIKSTWPPRVN